MGDCGRTALVARTDSGTGGRGFCAEFARVPGVS